MSVIEKYFKISRERAEKGIPLGDVCEYCHSSETRKNDNTCKKCGAPMKPFVGMLAGIPIDVDDYEEAIKLTRGIYAGTAVIYSALNKNA